MRRTLFSVLSVLLAIAILIPSAFSLIVFAEDTNDTASAEVEDYMSEEKKELEFTEELRSLSYQNVEITEGFIRDFTRLIVCEGVLADIRGVSRETGGLNNIKNAALKHRGESHGEFKGMFYVDENVHKTLEAMCYALALDPMGDAQIIAAQKTIKDTLEEWIPYYVDAQKESGHFATFLQIKICLDLVVRLDIDDILDGTSL